MKRTRRIEVIRYSRRVTVTTGNGTSTDLTDHTKLPVIDILPGVDEVIHPAPEQEDAGYSTNDVFATHEPPRQRLTLRLRDLLRLRW